MAVDTEEEAERSIGAYLRLLRDYPGWRILWIGEILSNIGNWFNYVATLLVVEHLAEGKGIYLSIVLVIHFLPSFVLFPIAGVLADRYNRLKIIIFSGLVSAGAVLLLPLVKHPSQLWLLYVLLIISFSTSAFYDPARRALTPGLVPKNTLHLATTLDSFAWSLTGAFGSSLGGLAASKIGTQACFYLDAITYLLAALCAFRLQRMLATGAVTVSSSTELVENPGSKQSSALPSSIPPKIEAEIPASQTEFSWRQPASGQQGLGDSENLEAGIRAGRSRDRDSDEEQGEASALLGDRQDQAEGLIDDDRQPAPEGFIPLILWGLQDEVKALSEGMRYACSSSNR